MESIMYHYVYRITNIKERKHYYGKRSSYVIPKSDLGIRYFSSSTNKQFIQDQKQNSKNYKYKILAVFQNSIQASLLEIKLHNRFDVAKNPSFYNNANQTSTGFDTTGKSFPKSEEWKQKHSTKMKGRRMTAEHKAKLSASMKGRPNPNKGKPGATLSDESKQKISAALKGRKRIPFTEEHKRKISEAKRNKSHIERH